MWLTVFKVALVVFLVVAVGVLAVTFMRKSKAKGFPTPESSSHFGQVKGAMPPMPKPEWATDSPDGNGDDADGRR